MRTSLDRDPQAVSGITLALAIALAVSAAAAHAAEADVSFSLPDDPDSVVVRMQHEVGRMGDGSGPSITLFAGGRVLVELPPYAKRAGRWEMQLEPGELRRRLRRWLRTGVAEFDEARTLRERTARRAARTGLDRFEPSLDDGATRLEIYLPSYRARGRGPGSASSGERLAKRIRWRALQYDARRYSELADLKALSEICEELDALMSSPSLVEVR